MGKRVVFCVPTITRPYQQCLDSLKASLPVVEAAGWEHEMANSIGCPYISRARVSMLTKAMKSLADVIVFIDHDLSWRPQDLLTLLETEGDVVAGTYRFKQEPEEYMGALIVNGEGRPIVREDGALRAQCAPAGFLKVTRNAINRFMLAYPHLMYVDEGVMTVDLFNHGAHKGVWYGEDYAFCRNWTDLKERVWIVPDLDITHWLGDVPYPGNFHQYLLRCDGGSESDNPCSPATPS
jgi:hypothetical protein